MTGPAAEVDRSALTQLLNTALSRRVCLVIGAAGWGKTAAVAGWATGKQATWLRADGQPGEVSRVLAALPVRSSERTPSEVCEALRQVLTDDLTLVLDDFHLATPDLSAFVAGLCRCAPNRLHLALISRREPSFPLDRLRGQGLATDVDAQRLAFDLDEIAELLVVTLGAAGRGAAESVAAATDGWPAAVRFAAEELRGVPPAEHKLRLRRLGRPGGRLHDYLSAQVAADEPTTTWRYLRDLAVLGQADAPLCAVLRIPTAKLSELTRRGLLRFEPGATDMWAPVRPLREFVCARPGPVPRHWVELRRRAAKQLAGRGAHAAALKQLRAAGDEAAIAALLVEHGSDLMDEGHVGAVLTAARLAPSHLDDPRIQRLVGQAHGIRGEWADALAWFQRAGDDEDLSPALAWRMGQVAYGRAEHREALATFRRGRLTTGGSPDEAVLLSWIAVAYRMTGEYQRFRQYVAATVAAADSCADLDARCAARAVQAMLAALDGDAPAAAAYCADGLRAAEAAGNLLQAGRIRVNQAWYLLEQGLATRALAEANAALAVAQRCGYAVLCGVALTIRGGAKLGLGQLGPADRDLILARDLFQNAGSRYAAWPLCGLGQLHRIRGELALAQAAYEEALALTEPTRETLGLSTALSGLARVCAADNIDAARRLAERAVSVGEPIRQVQALLTRGWVALLADDAAAARADADLAGAAARARRDRPGLAEALTLTALSDHGRGDQADLLDEVTGLWRSAGYPLDLAQARLVAAHLAGAPRGPDAALARRTLRYHGVAHGSRCAAGPLAAILRGSPAIAVRALGHFRVLRDGRPLPAGCWQSKKARDLFKILIAARGQPVPRDKLMELLWPQDNRRRTANRLSVLLSTLRTVLHPDRHATDPGPVIAENGAVRLDLDQVELDVERFLVAAHRAVDTTGPEQLALLLEAQKWYTGPFLADDPYHDWAVDVSEEVKAAYSAVLRPLAAQLRAAGDVDRAVRYTLRLLAEDRYDEPAHLDLINTLLDAGRRGEARRWYRIYRQRMRDLGVPPHPYPTERGVGPLA